jgi:hypothetical protein
MGNYFYNTRKTPISLVISGTIFLALAVGVAPDNYALAALFFLLAVGLWFVKEAVEIDVENKRFRKAIVLRNIKTGRWFPLEDIRFASARKVNGKADKWFVNLHLSEKKYYRLFKTDEDKAKKEAQKINGLLSES